MVVPLVQLLHYILNCIHLEWRWLFGPFRYMWIQTVRSKLLASWWGIIFRNVRRVHRFILCQNYMMFPLVLNPPPPILRLCIDLFAVAKGWLLLDIGWFVLFLQNKICEIPHQHNTIKHTGKHLSPNSTIIANAYNIYTILCEFHFGS